MKKLILCALGAAVMVASLGAVRAADEPKPADPAKPAAPAANRGNRPNRPGGGAGNVEERIKQMAEQLALTQEQQGKLKTLFTEEAKQQREIRDDTSLSQEQRREKMAKLRQDNQKKLTESKILTEEQLKKLEKLREENRKRAQERRQGQGQNSNSNGNANPPVRPSN